MRLSLISNGRTSFVALNTSLLIEDASGTPIALVNLNRLAHVIHGMTTGREHPKSTMRDLSRAITINTPS